MTQIRLNRGITSNIPQSVEILGTQGISALKDVTITSVSGDQILIYNASTNQFENVDISAIQDNLTEIDGGTY